MSHLPTARTATSTTAPAPTGVASPAPADLTLIPDLADAGEDGSLVAEYGLLAVVAATIAGVLIAWASNGAVTDFFDALLNHARGLVVR